MYNMHIHIHTHNTHVQGQPFNVHSYVVIARSYLAPTPLPTPHKRRKRQDGGGGGGGHDDENNSSPLLDYLEYEALQEVMQGMQLFAFSNATGSHGMAGMRGMC